MWISRFPVLHVNKHQQAGLSCAYAIPVVIVKIIRKIAGRLALGVIGNNDDDIKLVTLFMLSMSD